MATSVGRFLIAAVLLLIGLPRPVLGQDPGDAAAGEKVYNQTCIACHGADGSGGIPGVPDLNGKNSPLAKESHKVLLEHVLNGFRAPGAFMSMPAKGGNESLTIKDLQDVLKYMHEKFGYKLGPDGRR